MYANNNQKKIDFEDIDIKFSLNTLEMIADTNAKDESHY